MIAFLYATGKEKRQRWVFGEKQDFFPSLAYLYARGKETEKDRDEEFWLEESLLSVSNIYLCKK